MSSPSDWSQFYHQSFSNQGAPLGRTLSGTALGGDGVSEATVVTTSLTSATAPTLLGSVSPGSSGGGHLSPEGRVSKSVRRRSRASRRTPTTLLNTDTTNFRAMVQRFTGGPSAPYAEGRQLNETNFSFGLGFHQTHANSGNPVMVPAAAAADGYHLQHQPQEAQQYQHQNQPRPSYMFSLGNNNDNNSYGRYVHDLFLERIGIPSPVTASMETVSSDRLFVEGVSSQEPSPSAPPSRPPSFLR